MQKYVILYQHASMETPPFTVASFQSAHGQVQVLK